MDTNLELAHQGFSSLVFIRVYSWLQFRRFGKQPDRHALNVELFNVQRGSFCRRGGFCRAIPAGGAGSGWGGGAGAVVFTMFFCGGGSTRRCGGAPCRCGGSPGRIFGPPLYCGGLPGRNFGPPRRISGPPCRCGGPPRRCGGSPCHCGGPPCRIFRAPEKMLARQGRCTWWHSSRPAPRRCLTPCAKLAAR